MSVVLVCAATWPPSWLHWHLHRTGAVLHILRASSPGTWRREEVCPLPPCAIPQASRRAQLWPCGGAGRAALNPRLSTRPTWRRKPAGTGCWQGPEEALLATGGGRHLGGHEVAELVVPRAPLKVGGHVVGIGGELGIDVALEVRHRRIRTPARWPAPVRPGTSPAHHRPAWPATRRW